MVSNHGTSGAIRDPKWDAKDLPSVTAHLRIVGFFVCEDYNHWLIHQNHATLILTAEKAAVANFFYGGIAHKLGT